MTRCALLARVSTGAQAERDRHSLPMQREMMERFAREKGWEVTTTFEIPGESAWTEDRPQFFAAIEAAERREFDALIVYDISRFSRNQWVLHDTLRRLRLAGVQLWEVLLGAQVDEDPMLAGIRGAMAQSESDRMSRRVRDALAHRKAAYGVQTGTTPFGYAPGVPPTPIPEEAAAVLEVFQRRASGEEFESLARWLSTQGLCPRSVHGNTVFKASAVQSICENRFYCGYLKDGSRGAHEPIIPETLYEAVQALIRQRRPRTRDRHLLTGLARCGRCGAGIWTAQLKPGYTYYQESRKGCGGKLWRVEEVDAEVAEAVRGMALDVRWLSQIAAEAAPLVVDADPRDEARRRRAMELYLEGELPREEWERVKEETRPKRWQRVTTEPLLSLQRVGELWPWWTEQERQQGVRLLFEAVELDIRERTIAVRPHEEFEALFSCRAEYCLSSRGLPHVEPRQFRRFELKELVA